MHVVHNTPRIAAFMRGISWPEIGEFGKMGNGSLLGLRSPSTFRLDKHIPNVTTCCWENDRNSGKRAPKSLAGARSRPKEPQETPKPCAGKSPSTCTSAQGRKPRLGLRTFFPPLREGRQGPSPFFSSSRKRTTGPSTEIFRLTPSWWGWCLLLGGELEEAFRGWFNTKPAVNHSFRRFP